MYVYIQSEPRLWTVGFYHPEGAWQPESDHGSQEEAAKRVMLLNGGSMAVPMEEETLRDKFAAAALPQLMQSAALDVNDVTFLAYKYADAMIEARKGGK